MDEPIWIFIGIVAAILGLGIIAGVILRASDNGQLDRLRTAVTMLGAQCEQVCGLAENTALSVKVEVPKDAVLTTQEDRICGELAGKDGTLSCARCSCKHEFAVILNTTGAGAFYQSHEFSCRYTRLDTRNTDQRAMVNCTG